MKKNHFQISSSLLARKDYREQASATREHLTTMVASVGGMSALTDELKKEVFETLGFLTGIEEGYITHGRAQLAATLNQIFQRWPEHRSDEGMYTLLSNCLRFGFAVEGQCLQQEARHLRTH